MLEQPGGTLDGALGEVFVLEPAGDRSQRCVVPGLAVGEPLVELPDEVRSLVGYPAHLLCGGMIELAAGAQQDGRRDIVADPDGFQVRGEEQPARPEHVVAVRVGAALLAPALTALPDFTFPARKDSRFGVSLAQPAYLELWEVGLGNLGMRDAGSGMRELSSWLAALYQRPVPAPELFESYLHDAPVASRTSHPASPSPHPASRRTLSWWALLVMRGELAADAPAWSPRSLLLESQGLAVLRTGDRYASLECGPPGGGHGHPDRLHLTLHADGVHSLA